MFWTTKQSDYQEYLNALCEEQNEIIDRLNSQAQPEESSVEDWKKTYGVERAISSDALKVKQDTPEEWEKEFEFPDEIENEDYAEVSADKHKLWELCPWEEPELDPDKVVAFIKQLLEDREREAYHDGYTDGVTRCMDSLNKLEEDKNEGA